MQCTLHSLVIYEYNCSEMKKSQAFAWYVGGDGKSFNKIDSKVIIGTISNFMPTQCSRRAAVSILVFHLHSHCCHGVATKCSFFFQFKQSTHTQTTHMKKDANQVANDVKTKNCSHQKRSSYFTGQMVSTIQHTTQSILKCNAMQCQPVSIQCAHLTYTHLLFIHVKNIKFNN